MARVKQVLIYRTDLNMRKGKIAAQCAHASMKVFLDRIPDEIIHGRMVIPLTEDMQEWVEGVFTKIVLGVDSEADLLSLHEQAKALNLPTALIQDMGATEFHGVPTHTAIAIGPADSDAIDQVTRHGSVVTRLM